MPIELIPLKVWSAGQLRKGVSKTRQSYVLGMDDGAGIFRYLREHDRIMVDPVTHEVWRKVKRKKK